MKLRTPAIGAALTAALAVALVTGSGSSASALPAAPAAAAPVASAQVTVDWGATQYSTTSQSYGLNTYSGTAPSIATQPAYAANMAYMRAGLLRYHYAGTLGNAATDIRAWVDVPNKTWDAARIKAVFDAEKSWAVASDYRPQVLINIPSWPEWLHTYSITVRGHQIDGLLDPDDVDAYAAFCADLVKILNVDQKRRVKYFEILNERDDPYYVQFHNQGVSWDRLDDMIDIYNRVATAMRKVDPTIKVGGPAFNRADLSDQVHRFVRGTKAQLDFLSWHFYASGDTSDSDATIYDKTKQLGQYQAGINAIIKQESPHKAIPSWMDEYNISWAWWLGEPRMTNNKGAVFDALSMFATLDNGGAATAAWNDQDGVFGKMDAANQLRVSGHLFHLLNTYMVGKRVATTSSAPDGVVPFAVLKGSSRVLALVNRSGAASTVTVPGLRGDYVAYRIAADGYTIDDAVSGSTLGSGSYLLPQDSITVLVPAAVAGTSALRRTAAF